MFWNYQPGRGRRTKKIEEERAEDLAGFVVHLGLSPSEYWNLTVIERQTIIDTVEKRNTEHG
jgi:hypothetical protein